MPTPERPDEVDDILFDEGAVDELVHAGAPGSLAFPRLPEAPSSRRVDDGADDIFGDDPVAGDAAAAKPIVDAVDAALFGRAEPSAPTADVQPDVTPPDIAPFEAPFEEDDATVERELAAAPALLPLVVDDVDLDPAFAEGPAGEEHADEDAASESDGTRRGRRLALVAAAFLGLVVIAGATIGVMAFTGSNDSRPAVKTDREVTTTTAVTTTTTSPPPPAPDTVPPAANPPVTTARPRTPATTRPPAPPNTPAATQPTPPPPPPPPDPPPTDPPPPDTTLPVP
jgi:hypothetical protein